MRSGEERTTDGADLTELRRNSELIRIPAVLVQAKCVLLSDQRAQDFPRCREPSKAHFRSFIPRTSVANAVRLPEGEAAIDSCSFRDAISMTTSFRARSLRASV